MDVDINIILAIITLILLLGMGGVLFFFPFSVKPAEQQQQARKPEAALPQAGGRQQAARNQRARMRANAARQRQDAPAEDENHSDNENQQDEEENVDMFAADAKIGAKKRAKMELKAERKVAREAEEQMREERKAKEALKEEERQKQNEIEKAEELKREEEEKREIEERERREQEEYLKMKAAFSVEGEGFDEEAEDDTEKNLLQEFITYVKQNKVVVIEDLAAHFKLKTQAAIDRITTLQAEGHLTGVVDDRGKFIYISQQELENVAKFIKQRGRVSITDLVESSNQLINLVPVTVQN